MPLNERLTCRQFKKGPLYEPPMVINKTAVSAIIAGKNDLAAFAFLRAKLGGSGRYFLASC